MSTITWHYVLKFIITGDAAVGKSSLLVRLTDQRFLANPDPTLGVEFGSKLITIPDEDKIVKLQCWDTAGTESFRSITRSYYRGAAGCLLVYDVTSRKSFINARSWLADVREHADPNLTCILVGNKVDLCLRAEAPAPTATATETGPASGGSSGNNANVNDASSPLSSPPPSSSASSPPPPEPHRQRSGFVKPASSVATSLTKRREVTMEEAAQWAREEGLLFVEASAKSGENVEEAFVRAATDILSKIRRGVFDDDRSPGVKLSKPNPNSLTLEQAGVRSGCCSS